jgi:hypothetical protein
MAAHARLGREVLLDTNLANHRNQAAAGNGTIARNIERPGRYAQDGSALERRFRTRRMRHLAPRASFQNTGLWQAERRSSLEAIPRAQRGFRCHFDANLSFGVP